MDKIRMDRPDELPITFTVEPVDTPRRVLDRTLVPISIRSEDGLRVWTSILGPSTVLLARILLDEPGRHWHVADLAGQLGLAVSYTQRCIRRLNRFGWLVGTEDDGAVTYHVIDAAAVPPQQLERMHPELAARYARHCGLHTQQV